MKRLLKPAVFTLCLWPLGKLLVDGAQHGLTANPIAEVMNRLGFWTLVLLLVSLLPTPLKTLLGWTWPARVRRMLGLFAFFYGVLHFSVYLGVDQFFDLPAIAEDVGKRPFITVGFLALLLLVPLAVTSTGGWVKRLGYPAWKRLHRVVYLVAVLGVVHFAWRVKADLLEPAVAGGVLAVLLLVRAVEALRHGRVTGTRTRKQTAA